MYAPRFLEDVAPGNSLHCPSRDSCKKDLLHLFKLVSLKPDNESLVSRFKPCCSPANTFQPSFHFLLISRSLHFHQLVLEEQQI